MTEEELREIRDRCERALAGAILQAPVRLRFSGEPGA